MSPRGTVYVTRCSGAESFVHMTVNFDVVGSGRLFPVPTRLRFHTATRFEQLFSTLVRHWTTGIPITGSGAWGCCTKWPT